MKKRAFIMICVLAINLVAAVACASTRLLPDLKKQEGLITVYVGKKLLRMIGCDAVNVAPSVVDMDDIVRYLDSVEIVVADGKPSVSYLRPLMDSAIKGLKGLELAMEVQEDDQTVRIYTMEGSAPDRVSRILISVKGSEELTLIDLQGDIPADALSDMDI